MSADESIPIGTVTPDEVQRAKAAAVALDLAEVEARVRANEVVAVDPRDAAEVQQVQADRAWLFTLLKEARAREGRLAEELETRRRGEARLERLLMTMDDFFRRLLDLWNTAHEVPEVERRADFAAWSGATKDLLLGAGLKWNGEDYELPAAAAGPGAAGRGFWVPPDLLASLEHLRQPGEEDVAFYSRLIGESRERLAALLNGDVQLDDVSVARLQKVLQKYGLELPARTPQPREAADPASAGPPLTASPPPGTPDPRGR